MNIMKNGVVFDRHIEDNEKLNAQLYYRLIPVGCSGTIRSSGKNKK